jgi:hypothetical protein
MIYGPERFGKTQKVICINTGRDTRLTLWKVYEGYVFANGNVAIIDDNGLERTYSNKRITKLSDFRQNKLEEIGI